MARLSGARTMRPGYQASSINASIARLAGFRSTRSAVGERSSRPSHNRRARYRRGGLSHALSHGLSHGLSHDLPGSGPIAPPAREVVVGCLAKRQTADTSGGDAAGFALLRGSSAPWDRGTWSVPVQAGDNARGCTLFATVETTSGFSG
jgi:hypothetical protein